MEATLTFKGIRPLQRLKNLAMLERVPTPSHLACVPPDAWPGDAQKGRDLIAGVFPFAGTTIQREDLSWNPERATPEWLAALHGFEWLRDLRSVGGDRARRMAREMVSHWIAKYPKPDALSWRPDIIGSRIRSWISFHGFFCATADDSFQNSYFESLARQAHHLSTIRLDELSGIGKLRAWQGLAYAGIAMPENEKKLFQALDGIYAQLSAEILHDGCHISRCPQTTFAFLQVLVDLRAALIFARLGLPEPLQQAIDRIAPAVKFFRHADGALAQFNGGQEGNPHLAETTLMHAGARGRASASLPDGGYERLTLGRSSLIMDTGTPRDPAFSSSAHAGLLSFEYAFGRERLIVNCGSVAAEGTWRRVLRGTAAHSTLCVDGRNALSIEESGLVSVPPGLRRAKREDGNIVLLEASHNGYVPRFGLVHHRCVRLADEGDLLRGDDQLSGKSGIPFAIRFHLHPDARAALINNGWDVDVRTRNGAWRFSATGAKILLEDSIYAARGEAPVPTKQIVLTAQTASPVTTVNWELKRIAS